MLFKIKIAYGAWLGKAFDRFQEDNKRGFIASNFDDWVDTRCQVKQRQARQLRKFYKLFSSYKKVLSASSYMFR